MASRGAVLGRTEPTPGTFLFTDIEGSTRTGRRLGNERWIEVLSDHHQIIGDAIVGAGGTIDHTEGDAFVAVFGDPTAAVSPAVEAQRRLSAHRWPEDVGSLRVRMGFTRARSYRTAPGISVSTRIWRPGWRRRPTAARS